VKPADQCRHHVRPAGSKLSPGPYRWSASAKIPGKSVLLRDTPCNHLDPGDLGQPRTSDWFGFPVRRSAVHLPAIGCAAQLRIDHDDPGKRNFFTPGLPRPFGFRLVWMGHVKFPMNFRRLGRILARIRPPSPPRSITYSGRAGCEKKLGSTGGPPRQIQFQSGSARIQAGNKNRRLRRPPQTNRRID